MIVIPKPVNEPAAFTSGPVRGPRTARCSPVGVEVGLRDLVFAFFSNQFLGWRGLQAGPPANPLLVCWGGGLR